MTNSIDVRLFRKELMELLDECFENTHGFFLDRGTSLLDTLDVLTPDQASAAISPAGATIAGHVDHVRFYLDVLTDDTEGKAVGKIDWEASWRVREVDDVEWRELLVRLRQAYRRLVEVLQGLEDWNHENPVGAPMAILAHTAAHLGSIRQALRQVG
ncbi:MAG: DinB family protein [Candidatus Bipolaricaulota bacterium]|nr:MAG: DinB family protein [Candidatus Bipolaricaulota bacterium]